MNTKTILLPWLHECPANYNVTVYDDGEEQRTLVTTNSESILDYKRRNFLTEYNRYPNDPDIHYKMLKFREDAQKNVNLIKNMTMADFKLCMYVRDVRTLMTCPYRLDKSLTGTVIVDLTDEGLVLTIQEHSMMDYLTYLLPNRTVQESNYNNRSKEDDWFKEISTRLSALDPIFGKHIMFSEYVKTLDGKFVPSSITITDTIYAGMSMPFSDIYLDDYTEE